MSIGVDINYIKQQIINVDELLEQLSECKATIRDLTASKVNMEKQLEEAILKSEEYHNLYVEETKKTAKLKTKLSKIELDDCIKTEYKEKLKNVHTKVKDLQNENYKIQGELKITKEEVQKLRNEAAKVKDSRETLQTKLQDLERTKCVLMNRLKRMEESQEFHGFSWEECQADVFRKLLFETHVDSEGDEDVFSLLKSMQGVPQLITPIKEPKIHHKISIGIQTEKCTESLVEAPVLTIELRVKKVPIVQKPIRVRVNQLRRNRDLPLRRMRCRNLNISDTESSSSDGLVRLQQIEEWESNDSGCVQSEIEENNPQNFDMAAEDDFVVKVLTEMKTVPRVLHPLQESPVKRKNPFVSNDTSHPAKRLQIVSNKMNEIGSKTSETKIGSKLGNKILHETKNLEICETKGDSQLENKILHEAICLRRKKFEKSEKKIRTKRNNKSSHEAIRLTSKNLEINEMKIDSKSESKILHEVIHLETNEMKIDPKPENKILHEAMLLKTKNLETNDMMIEPNLENKIFDLKMENLEKNGTKTDPKSENKIFHEAIRLKQKDLEINEMKIDPKQNSKILHKAIPSKMKNLETNEKKTDSKSENKILDEAIHLKQKNLETNEMQINTKSENKILHEAINLKMKNLEEDIERSPASPDTYIPDTKNATREENSNLEVNSLDSKKICILKQQDVKFPTVRTAQVANWAQVKRMLKHVVNYQGEETITNFVLNRIKLLPEVMIIDYFLRMVANDRKDMEKPDLVNEPLLTTLQKLLIGMLVLLETDENPNIITNLLKACEVQILFKNDKLLCLERLARFYVGVCHMRGYIYRVRRMVFDSLYFLGDIALVFIYQIISSWPAVLHVNKEDVSANMMKDKPLIKVFIQVILTKTCKSSEYYLIPLKNLMTLYYKYPKEQFNPDDLMKEFLEMFMYTLNKNYLFSILILCKNNKKQWVDKKLDLIKELIKIVKDEKVKSSLGVLVNQINLQFVDKECKKGNL